MKVRRSAAGVDKRGDREPSPRFYPDFGPRHGRNSIDITVRFSVHYYI